jgi:methylmalonic aciduria homocystinuria type C protein
MQVFAGCVRSLERRGLDCSACLSLGTYNAAAPSAVAIKGAGKHQESCLVVVFGNSKVLWDHFVDAYKEDKDVRDSADPLDAFVEKATRASIREALGLTEDEEIPGVRVYWSKDTEDGKLVAIQRMAHEARLAYLDETTHQSIHPKFGPWCAFRGAIVFDNVMGPDAMPAPMTCPVSDETVETLRKRSTSPLGITRIRLAKTQNNGNYGSRRATPWMVESSSSIDTERTKCTGIIRSIERQLEIECEIEIE